MRIVQHEGQEYRLPNSLNKFQFDMYIHMIKWKWKHISRATGIYRHNGKELQYDAILPREYNDQRDMPHIHHSIVNELKEHLKHNSIKIHPHFYHIVSSQAATINLFLPVLKDPHVNDILRNVKSDFESLATGHLFGGYCLEYWGGNDNPNTADTGPLADKNSRSGTDTDIAIAYRNRQGKLCLWLIEHKLAESEFTTCGGSKSPKRMKRHNCSMSFDDILKNKHTCYYHDIRMFKYWDITEEHKEFFSNNDHLEGCPFKRGTNQLWRNQLLALAIENDNQYPFSHACFSVLKHPGNTYLDKTISDYKGITNNNPKFTIITSDSILDSAEKHGDDSLREWITWYRELYKL